MSASRIHDKDHLACLQQNRSSLWLVLSWAVFLQHCSLICIDHTASLYVENEYICIHVYVKIFNVIIISVQDLITTYMDLYGCW